MGKVGGTIPIISSKVRVDFQTDFRRRGETNMVITPPPTPMMPPVILFTNHNVTGHTYSNPTLAICLIILTIILGAIAISIISYFENK